MQVELPLECIPQVAVVQDQLVPQQLAIYIRDVNLSYSKKKVLSGLSLSVPRGSMYGLLGPSGCGKTVLIRCILGTLKPTSGSIEVFGHQPGKSHSVGYMPQHTALFPQLTIRETFNYFGSIYGLEQAQLNQQCQFLIESLHLPTQTDQLVGLLSGDQKRRLSLTIALIHKPKLLILDEPTRGMNSLNRKFIWEYLVELSLTAHLTVLVTSDCIEEVKNYANLIGLMRHGHILAQDSPSALLDRFQMNTLEQGFLYLSAEAEAAIVNENPNNEQASQVEVLIKELSPRSSSVCAENVPEAVEGNIQQPVEPVINELMLSDSDKPQTVPPIDIRMNPVVSKSTQMNTLEQVSLHLSTDSGAATDDDANPSVELLGEPEDSLKISSSDVESIPDVFVVVEDNASEKQPTEQTDESKMNSVTNIPVVSKCTQIGAMVIKNIRTLYRYKVQMIFQLFLPTVLVVLFCLWCIGTRQMYPIPVAVYDGGHHSLTDQLINKLGPNILNLQFYNSGDDAIRAVRMGKTCTALVLYSNFPECFDLAVYGTGQERCNMSIHLYPSLFHQQMASFFHVELIKILFDNLRNSTIMAIHVIIKDPIYSYLDYVPAPSTISSIAFFCAIRLTSISLLTEKKNGLIERTLVSGVSYFHILLSHLIPQMTVLVFQMMSLVVILFPLFGIPFHFQYLLAMSLLSRQSVCGMCFGLFVSTIARNWNIAIMTALGLFYLNLMLSDTVFSIGTMIDYVNYGYQFEVICAFSLTFILSGIFLLAATLMARYCL